MELKENNKLCENYLDIVYRNMPGHRACIKKNKSHISDTYGEILYPSIQKLISLIPLTDKDIFVDLGSGTGKIVLQVFLNTLVKEARGIELSQPLHEQALIASQRVQRELPAFYEKGRELVFINGSFLEIPLTRATIVIVNSMCYTQHFLHTLGKIIDNTPSIHTFMTLRPIGTMRRLHFKKAVRIECSWDTTLCYIYSTAMERFSYE